MGIDPRLARNYADLPSEQQKEVYRNWAEDYDRELIEDFGYVAPKQAVEVLRQRVPNRFAPILDMGCGTGLVGKQLVVEGYHVIDGLDLSQIYGAILCVGVFSHKLSQPFDLAKLFLGLLPSGLLIATVNGRGWRDIDWPDLLQQSARQHRFTIEEIIDIPYLDKQEIDGKLLILSDGN